MSLSRRLAGRCRAVGIALLVAVPLVATGQERQSNEGVDEGALGTYAPGDGLEASISGAEYRLGPGDVLAVNIWGPQPVVYRLDVTPEGNVLIPAVGEIEVDGLLLREAKRAIRREILRFFRNVDVSVTLVRLRRFQIHVLGQVNAPGTYLATGVDRVSAAVSRAGGLAGAASQRRIQVMSGESLRVEADLYSFLRRGILAANPLVRDGDVIYVPYAKETFKVLGAVSDPGAIQFLPGDRLSDALRLSGGFNADSYLDTLEVARYEPGSSDPMRFFIIPDRGLAPAGGKVGGPLPTFDSWFLSDSSSVTVTSPVLLPDFELQPFDVILVRSIPEYRKRQLVEVGGEVVYPGLYPIVVGQTRLADLVEWAGGLTEDAFLIEAKLIRRTSIGLQDLEFERLKNVPVADMSEEEYEYYKIKSREVPGAMVVDFREALAHPDSEHNLLLERSDLIMIPQRRDFVSVLGLVRHPGNVAFQRNLSWKEYVRRSGGFASDADRTKSRVIRAEGGEWIPLKRAPVLEPGDTILVPEKPDRDFWRTFRDLVAVTTQILTIYLIADRAVGN